MKIGENYGVFSLEEKPQRHIISIVYHAHTNNNYDNREHSLSIYLQQEQ